MVGEPAQVKIECGHRLGFRPSRGRNVVFLDAAQHRGSDARDHVIEAVDKTLKAVIEPIAPHHAAGSGFGERQIQSNLRPELAYRAGKHVAHAEANAYQLRIAIRFGERERRRA